MSEGNDITDQRQPNIVLIMCDDLGYGDTGFNGNQHILTPCLDAMRAQGGRFERFYAGGPVCSPTRGTCLTGRHYSRYGITHANVGHLPGQEFTLARLCKQQGYTTGHFGKWHLGTLDRAYSGKPNRDPARHYAPPWERDYDRSFCTEFAVPTWDPGLDYDGASYARSEAPWHSPYYLDGVKVDDLLRGCDSKLIVDEALGFIRSAAQRGLPFMTTVWFHAPHTPVAAGPDYHAQYAGRFCDEEAHYYGCVSAMDEQVGRLNDALRQLDLSDNTIVFFCSDNGPEGGEDLSRNRRSRGVTGGLRGRKRSLFDGGIRVPALVTWPGQVAAGSEISCECSTLDYLPTLAAAMGVTLPDDRPYDGIDVSDILGGERQERGQAIPYRFLERRSKMFGAPTLGLMDGRYKYLTNLSADGAEDLFFDLAADRTEGQNIISENRDRAMHMREQLQAFMSSCRASHLGADYAESYSPADPFQEVDGHWKPEAT